MLRRLLLVAAFLFCAVGVYGLLAGSSGGAENRPATVTTDSRTEVEVWQARHTLAKGAPVSFQDLESFRFIKDKDERPSPFEIKPGAIARAEISAGTRMTNQLLVAPGDADYIDHLITPGMIPYPFTVAGSSHQGVLTPGDRVDVVMIASLEQNLASGTQLTDFRGLSIGPLLTQRRVLAVEGKAVLETSASAESTIILELSRDEVSRLMIAKRIGVLDIHKSVGTALPTVRTGDVLPGYSSVTELRGTERLVN